jgi:hypothetical protein
LSFRNSRVCMPRTMILNLVIRIRSNISLFTKIMSYFLKSHNKVNNLSYLHVSRLTHKDYILLRRC